MHFSITAIIIKLFFTFVVYVVYFVLDIKISRCINRLRQYYEDKNSRANKLLKMLYWLIIVFIWLL